MNERPYAHKIGTLILELTLPNDRGIFEARQQAEQLFTGKMLSTICSTFDKFVTSEQHVHLERLEVDLQMISLEPTDEYELETRLIGVVQEALPNRLQEVPETPPVQVDLAEALVTFLESGLWPWDAAYDNAEQVEMMLRKLDPLAKQSLVARLQPVLKKPRTLRRLKYQFSEEFANQVIGKPLSQEKDSGGVDRIDMTVEKSPQQELITMKPVKISEVEDIAVNNNGMEGYSHINAGSHSESSSDIQWTINNRITDLTIDTQLEPLFIPFAGIVLLHPFLESFFSHLELLEEDKDFVSVEARTLAVHLLHYLATGNQNPVEQNTVIFKVMCGYPLRQPLIKNLPLANSARNEADQLLRATIQHWKKLGSTSPDGLRQGFFQREGKLISIDAGWRLIVEQHGIDVLLGALPWSLSRIKLPWLQYPIRIEWV